MKIGLLSDTHGFLDPKVFKYFEHVDEIWHAGDIGSEEVLDELEKIAPVRAVYGNIDNQKIRARCPEIQDFEIEGMKVFMIHIGGHTKRFAKGVREEILKRKPNLFISGHSHILKVIYDQSLSLLHMNPGAAGISGFHKVRTLLLFEIDKAEVKNLRVVELGSRSKS